MGEVYQATDSKLGRDVAIKLLPEAFTHDSIVRRDSSANRECLCQPSVWRAEPQLFVHEGLEIALYAAGGRARCRARIIDLKVRKQKAGLVPNIGVSNGCVCQDISFATA